VAESKSIPHNTTLDDANYSETNDLYLFGAHFFLSGEKVEHKRAVFTLLGLLSKVGGLL